MQGLGSTSLKGARRNLIELLMQIANSLQGSPEATDFTMIFGIEDEVRHKVRLAHPGRLERPTP